jgi:hypothetical protein
MAGSASNRRKVLRFGLWFVPLFLVFLLLYQWIMPIYQEGVLAVVNPYLGSLSPALRLDADSRGDLSAYTPLPGGKRKDFFYEKYRPWPIYLNLVLLPALVLATPVRLEKRIRLLAIGMVLLFFWNALSMICLFRTQLCLMQNPESFVCSWLKGLAMTSGQIGSVLGWAALTWGYWFPRRGD